MESPNRSLPTDFPSLLCKETDRSSTPVSLILGLEINRKKRRKDDTKSPNNSNNETKIQTQIKNQKKSWWNILSKNQKRNYKSKWLKEHLIAWTLLLVHVMNVSQMKRSTTWSYLTVLVCLISKSNVCCEPGPCGLNQWWSQFRNSCLPCTACPSGMIAIRPCEFHRDTICGSISDLTIDWISGKAEPNWKERRKTEFESRDQFLMDHELNHGLYLSGQVKEDVLLLDWITITFFVAASICLVLFVIAAFILFYHMRQWRKIEESLTNDVEELSSKFLTKLAEVQRVETGAFLIRSSDTLRYPGYQGQYVLLPAKNIEHQNHDRRYVTQSCQTGNVYIEEI